MVVLYASEFLKTISNSSGVLGTIRSLGIFSRIIRSWAFVTDVRKSATVLRGGHTNPSDSKYVLASEVGPE